MTMISTALLDANCRSLFTFFESYTNESTGSLYSVNKCSFVCSMLFKVPSRTATLGTTTTNFLYPYFLASSIMVRKYT